MIRYFAAVVESSLPHLALLGFLAGFCGRGKTAGGPGFPWRGAGLGALTAIAMVAIRKSSGLIVREHYNLALLLPSLPLEALLLSALIVWSLGRRPPETLPIPVRTAMPAAVFCWTAFWLPHPLLFPFDFAVGMDNVFNSDFAGKTVGYAAGLATVGLSFAAMSALFRRLPAGALGPFLAAALLVFMLRDGLAVLRTMLARGMLPRGRFLVALAIGSAEREAWFLHFFSAAAAIVALIVFMRSRRIFPAGTENPAEARKLRAAARNRRRWCLAAWLALAASVSSVAAAAFGGRADELKPPETVTAADGEIALSVEKVGDGGLHRFRYVAPGGVETRFIVIRKNPSSFGVGLDACAICGPTGYFERDGQVICGLCDVVMNKSSIGFPGGCNPVPLAHRTADGVLTVKAGDLEKEAWRFSP